MFSASTLQLYEFPNSQSSAVLCPSMLKLQTSNSRSRKATVLCASQYSNTRFTIPHKLAALQKLEKEAKEDKKKKKTGRRRRRRKGKGDALSAGQPLSASITIQSEGGKFVLGFFRPGASSKIYLGIWYNNNLGVKEIVWVANREKPLSDASSSRLELSKDGNLVLLEDSSNIPFWSTDLTHPLSNSTEAVLRDDGNFVLRNSSNPNTIFWESFDHPTDTWLPGAKLGIDKLTGQSKQLISWKNSEDPAPGMFSFRLAPDGSKQYILEWNRSQSYWSTGIWNEKYFSLAPDMLMNYITNPSFVSNENESYFTYSIQNSSSRFRFVIMPSGQLQQLSWSEKSWAWTLFWSRPVNISDVYGLCGAFGVNYENFTNPCVCLNGFKPSSIEETSLSDWSGGCVRKSPLQCMNTTNANGKKDWFMKIPIVRLPDNSKAYSAVDAMNCEAACMNNCSCRAYAYTSSGCMVWEEDLLNLQNFSNGGETEQNIHLRLAADEIRQQTESVGDFRRAGPCNRAYLMPLNLLFMQAKAQTQSSEFHEINDGTNPKSNVSTRGKKDGELPVFSYESVSAATNNFSAANKLGQGGFGPVYKGKSLKGQEIAVKMLSKKSGQGLEEFRNETILIAKLQHRNLVRLLGCCMEGDEKMLIYEYMPNKSLDFYLFDQTKKRTLNWRTRISIIEGIAQGLLYLHQYSRLRIIHRDLKPSNILLDSEMNPKISDFGMARIVGDNETQTNTHRIVGTYGYMSPEYAMDGLYSIKSDVFSFGVLVLEIVSGKKNTGFYNSESLNLLRYAWELWRDDRSLDLMEPTIGYPSSTSVPLRFINIGLLCVQESPTDRPTMSDVISMISNEYAPLPTPKQPAFTRGRNVMDTNSAVNSVRNGSIYNLTISIMEAR
uniref:Receptor-like serine/threonine-protein kinase n=1 Tax=Betula platyphylla TaxID=78630 RepID=A0A9E9NQI6_BETPL|nr:birch protein [Betula platyphylla]